MVNLGAWVERASSSLPVCSLVVEDKCFIEGTVFQPERR